MGYLGRLLFGDAVFGREQEFYWLWILATTAYGVGDIVTTLTILQYDLGVKEANLLLKHVFDSLGEGGLIALKLSVFLGCLTISLIAAEYWDDWPLYYTPPVLLTVLGTVVTVHNLRLLLA